MGIQRQIAQCMYSHGIVFSMGHGYTGVSRYVLDSRGYKKQAAFSRGDLLDDPHLDPRYEAWWVHGLLVMISSNMHEVIVIAISIFSFTILP